MSLEWEGIRMAASKSYTCGHCGERLAANVAYSAIETNIRQPGGWIYICHFCYRPTFFDLNGRQIPGAAFGNSVNSIESIYVKNLYEEARNCMKVNAYTAAALCCRKLLMNVAVAKNAKKDLNFADYVDFFYKEGLIPKDSKEWVDHIRDKGNEATHEIPNTSREDAEDLITFSEMLLKIIFEFPSRVRSKAK